MAFNEKLHKLLEKAQGVELFIHDSVLRENNEFKKQHTLFHVKLKALLMDKKDVDLWWDVVQDIVQKDIGNICRRYERNKRFYMHRTFRMENVISSFEYEPLVFSL